MGRRRRRLARRVSALPVAEEQSRCCVVGGIVNGASQLTRSIQAFCLGLSVAVTTLTDSVSVGRRLTGTIVSMYFDDAHLTDLGSARGSGQHAFGEVNCLMGSPFAAEKRQAMASSGTFLGLGWDFTLWRQRRAVRFWVRSRLQDKVESLLRQAELDEALPSGTASKLYGILNFLEQGIYGRIGTGGLHALKERQNETGRELTRALRHTFETILSVLRLKSQREVEILPSPCERSVAASDAADYAPRQGTGGFLLVWGGEYQLREAFVAEITKQTYEAFLPGEAKIAPLGLSMVLFALTSRASTFRRRRGVWYIDNVA